jgi:hypothetical protein
MRSRPGWESEAFSTDMLAEELAVLFNEQADLKPICHAGV